ncbi:ribosomal protein S18-alanine N-acetyltransferase [Agaribacterium sp. ZY112]|uniref:ribosomal protein S18-alanine N-acetyltransferase n=1 Tax=Agaribacterium sp. ZY112 TaxID=3233574 RepID=UPI0035264B7B
MSSLVSGVAGGEYELVDLTIDDFESISAIELGASKHPWPESALRRILNNDQLCLGLCCAGELIAYAVFHIVLDEAELLIISVKKDKQGLGLGSLFLNQVCKLLLTQGLIRLMLEVRASNKAAIKLYSSLGFSLDGRRKGYYKKTEQKKEREDALLYSLSLAAFN